MDLMHKKLILFIVIMFGAFILTSIIADRSVAVAQSALNVSGIVYQDFNNSGSRENAAAFSYAGTGKLGAVYGLAYQHLTYQIFFANYARHHVGTTPNGGVVGANPDTLYMYDRRQTCVLTQTMNSTGTRCNPVFLGGLHFAGD